MNLSPLGDKIIVTIADAEEQTESGIVLPESAQERPQQGNVTAVGPGRRLKGGKIVMSPVHVGDRVIFAKYTGSEVKLEGQEYLIVEGDDLLGVIS